MTAAAALPRPLRWARRALHHVGRAELAVAAVLLGAVIALSATQALLRYTFDTSIWWAQEAGLTAIMVSYFLGISYVFKSRQYIVVEFVARLLPRRVALALYIVTQLVTAAVCVVIIVQFHAFSDTLRVLRSPILGIPKIYAALPLIVGLAMIVPTSLYYAAAALACARRAGTDHSIEGVEASIRLNEPL